MEFLYNIGIRAYYLGVLLASVFNKKAKLWIEGRRGQFIKMEQELAGEESIVWVHCASLGEFEQGRPVIEKWKENHPESKILLTFYSPSGYEIRKDYEAVDFVYYLPLDTKKNARKFFELVNPKYSIFIKYEFWYHFLRKAKESGTQLILISAIFRPDQLFFKSYGAWYRKMLSCFDAIFVQDVNSLKLVSRFENLSVNIAGDTRFDRVAEIAKETQAAVIAENFSKGRFTYVLGSTWTKDEDLLIRYINENNSDACFIIAPHEIGKNHIQQLVNRMHRRVALYSMANGDEIKLAKVLILDNIGILSSTYRYGDVAFLGGGFGKGIHNILEPAVYGMPVVFGPKYRKFREAIELVKEGGAFPVSSFEELKSIFDTLREDKKKLEKTSIATKQFVQRNLGATGVILNYLKKA